MSTKRHTLYNLGGALAPVAMMLLSVPLYLGLVGEERYGVLAIVWLFTGYFSFFDFGLGRATAYAIARHADGDDEIRARTFWTALIINIGFGAIGGLVLLAGAPYVFLDLLKLTPALQAEIAPVLPWIALAVPLLTLEGVFTGALTGRQRFFELNVRSAVGTAITQFLPLVFVWRISPTLDVAIPATIMARTISVAILTLIAFRAVGAGPRPLWGGKVMARELLSYGGWISLASFLDPLIANFDRFLIASYLNAAAVAHYVVPFQMVTRGGLFSRALANALFPRFAHTSAEDTRTLGLKAMRANAALLAVLCSSGIMIMEPFLTLWIDAGFAAKASAVGQQLALSTWLTSLALVPYNILQAQGRPRETAYVLIAQTVPFVLLAFAGVHYLGILGVAIARNFRSLINLLLLAGRTGFLRDAMRLITLPMALVIFMIAALNYLPFAILVRYAVAGVFWIAIVAHAYRMFPEGLGMALDFVRRRAARA